MYSIVYPYVDNPISQTGFIFLATSVFTYIGYVNHQRPQLDCDTRIKADFGVFLLNINYLSIYIAVHSRHL